jgi:hypothetical protein
MSAQVNCRVLWQVTFALFLECLDNLVDNFHRLAPSPLRLLDLVGVAATGDYEVVDVQHFVLVFVVCVPQSLVGWFLVMGEIETDDESGSCLVIRLTERCPKELPLLALIALFLICEIECASEHIFPLLHLDQIVTCYFVDALLLVGITSSRIGRTNFCGRFL